MDSAQLWRALNTLSTSREPSCPYHWLALGLQCSFGEAGGRFAEIFKAVGSAPPPTFHVAQEEEVSPLNDSFSFSELEAALHDTRCSTASGPDGITTQALQNVPDLSHTWILAWLNGIWETGKIPPV